MAVSLAKQVGLAADQALAEAAELSSFSKLATSDGMSLRRFYRASNGTEHEICVYRDKWWSKDGGRVQVELYCLVHDFQRSLGGMEQSWLEPDYSLPLHHFQHGLSRNADSPHWQVSSNDDVKAFQSGFAAWLGEVATPWLIQFASTHGVVRYLRAQQRFADLARFLLRKDQPGEANDALAQYFRSAPRQIERTLELLTNDGLLTAREAESLRFASMQREDEYREAVEAWLAGKALQDRGSATL